MRCGVTSIPAKLSYVKAGDFKKAKTATPYSG